MPLPKCLMSASDDSGHLEVRSEDIVVIDVYS